VCPTLTPPYFTLIQQSQAGPGSLAAYCNSSSGLGGTEQNRVGDRGAFTGQLTPPVQTPAHRAWITCGKRNKSLLWREPHPETNGTLEVPT
jgi:hypothetical protein